MEQSLAALHLKLEHPTNDNMIKEEQVTVTQVPLISPQSLSTKSSKSLNSSTDHSSEFEDESLDYEREFSSMFTNLNIGSESYTMQEYLLDDLDSVYQLFKEIVDAPFRGHHFFGIDEYITEEALGNLLTCGESILIFSRYDCSLMGFFCITSTKFTRSFGTNNGDVVLGLSSQALSKHDGLFKDVMKDVLHICQSLNYTGKQHCIVG